jgi:ufm1-conjugating enzyme 1
LQFEIPVTYPVTPIEMELPELDGKTSKMYRGGKICLTIHFKPLWAKNAPHFGIAHALALGVCSRVIIEFCSALFYAILCFYPQLAPWMAAEVPHLVTSGVLTDSVKSKDSAPAEAASAPADQ